VQLSQSVPEEKFGSIIRAERRGRGLSQSQLAELLGVKQAIISQWENGKEPIPRAQKLCLIDVFQNKRGRITPVIERMIRRDPTISVQTVRSDVLLRESPLVLNAYRLEKVDVEGFHHVDVFESKWRTRLGIPVDLLSADYERDIELNAERHRSTGLRFKVEIFCMELEGNGLLAFRKNHLVSEFTGANPKLSSLAVIGDLDSPS